VILPPGKSFTIENLKADRLPVIMVNCNIHPWMSAKVAVFDHPYFAVTDDKGGFEIKNAPAGDYKLVTWHEAVGWGEGGRQGKSVTIKKGEPTEAEVKIQPKE